MKTKKKKGGGGEELKPFTDYALEYATAVLIKFCAIKRSLLISPVHSESLGDISVGGRGGFIILAFSYDSSVSNICICLSGGDFESPL